MPTRANPVSLAKTWADEIDDLYHQATERTLRELLGTRARTLVRDAEGPHDADNVQRPVPVHR